jgi:hypothetical protein
MRSPRTLRALCSLPGFIASFSAQGRVRRPLRSHRRPSAPNNTAQCSCCGHRCRGRYDQRTVRVRDIGAADWRIYLEFERWRVWCPRCRNVFVAQLDWLATNPRYTRRFALHVGPGRPRAALRGVRRARCTSARSLSAAPRRTDQGHRRTTPTCSGARIGCWRLTTRMSPPCERNRRTAWHRPVSPAS